MSTYEIDDEDVRCLVDNLDLLPPGLALHLGRLEEQIPIPAPPKIGAVVRTVPALEHLTGTVFVRWAPDSRTLSPWIEAGNHELPYRTDEIGRIVEVLAEGVDL